MLKITIPGNPIPRARPRINKFRTYDPQYKEMKAIKSIIQSQVKEKIEGAVTAEFKFFLPIPKSTSKKKRAMMLANEVKHVKKPDTSNFLKFYEDAMNDIAYHDDSAIWDVKATKVYSDDPRTEIILSN